MKLSEIKEPGFYWNRLDEHRAWGMVYVKRQMPNPMHPRHNMFMLHSTAANGPDSHCSEHGDFLGPITPPDARIL